MARIPDEYRQYMSKMNDMVVGGFTFKNCPDSWRNQWGDTFYIRSYPAENYSFFTTARNGGSNISVFSFKNNDGMSPINLQASAKLTLNVTGSENSCTGIVEHITDINIAHKGSTNYQYIDLKVNSDWSCIIYSGSSYGNISTPTNDITLTQTGTLAEVLDYFSTRLRNVDVYVNGVPWDDVVTYNWQSVPSISGKNGILQSLVQIKEEAINDGEPVSEATVLAFDSLGNINIPSVIDEQMPVDPSDVTSVTATYLIPALEDGTYEGIKLLVKKGSIPTSEEDADKVVNLDEPTSILRIDSKSVGNLDEDSHYYFVVKLVDELGTEATSEPKDIWTSHSEGWTFDYTGSIQTFVAPKTGIYQLETWGAQGGNASDGTLTARGGYGAYAVGEVLLTQGETIYINVGGQNGYGGGGVMPYINPDYILENANSQIAEVIFEGYNIHRIFYKTNSGFSCVLMLYIDNYVGCVLLSNVSASSVYYKAIDDGSAEYTNNDYFTINYKGQIWYMSKTGLFAVNAYGTWIYPILHISATDYPSMTSGVYDEAEITQFLDLAFEVLGQ